MDRVGFILYFKSAYNATSDKFYAGLPATLIQEIEEAIQVIVG
jgi:hypothetical protein